MKRPQIINARKLWHCPNIYPHITEIIFSEDIRAELRIYRLNFRKSAECDSNKQKATAKQRRPLNN